VAILKRYHKYSINEIDNMYPFELHIHEQLINEMLQVEKDKSGHSEQG
jgi:hypothetical protein